VLNNSIDAVNGINGGIEIDSVINDEYVTAFVKDNGPGVKKE
jgi:C4-dicarboxylate-specific signal transduction histidine kinase